MNGTTINKISEQYKLVDVLKNADLKNWRGSPRHTFSMNELTSIKIMHKNGLTKDQIAENLKVSRNVFMTIRNNEKHPNHDALIDIFGPIKRRQRHKPTKSQLKAQAEAQAKAQAETENQMVKEELNFLAINHLCEYIMGSHNSQINAQDKDVAERYKYLSKALAKYLRLDDVNDESYVHSKALFDKVTKELINVTRKIYDEKESSKKSQDEKNT